MNNESNYKYQIIIFILSLILLTNNSVKSEIISKVIVLVDGIPITVSDVKDRSLYLEFRNPDAQKDTLPKEALKQLVDEALMLDKAREYGISDYTDNQVISSLDISLKAQGISYEGLSQELEGTDIDPITIINQRRSYLQWNDYIRRKYRRLANVTLEDINQYRDNILSKELFHIQILTINIEGLEPKESLFTLKNIEDNFQSCSQNLFLYKEVPNIVIKDKIDISISEIEEPLKSLILFNLNNFLLPPQASKKQIKLYINCTPKQSLANNAIENILVSEQLNLYSVKILRDIKQDSSIEFKNR
jgi:hypothetical protein